MTTDRRCFLSTILTVPKKTGDIDLSSILMKVNRSVHPLHHFMTEEICSERSLEKVNFKAEIHLMDAYFTLPISKPDRKYPRFR